MTHLLAHLRLITVFYITALLAASLTGQFNLPVTLGAVWAVATGATYFHYARRYL